MSDIEMEMLAEWRAMEAELARLENALEVETDAHARLVSTNARLREDRDNWMGVAQNNARESARLREEVEWLRVNRGEMLAASAVRVQEDGETIARLRARLGDPVAQDAVEGLIADKDAEIARLRRELDELRTEF